VQVRLSLRLRLGHNHGAHRILSSLCHRAPGLGCIALAIALIGESANLLREQRNRSSV
jgi:hypothetical protein